MNTYPQWLKWTMLAMVLLGFSACAKHRTVLVLIPDPDGAVGAVEVRNDAGSQVVASAGQMVLVKGSDNAPSEPRVIDQDEIDALFGTALKAQPPIPEQFTLNFITGTSILTAPSRHQLPDIIMAIKRHTPPEVIVIGHTDRVGGDQANYRLALERAERVRNILIEEGIPSAMIEVDSHGEGNPIVETADGVPEPRNRRVEVFVR